MILYNFLPKIDAVASGYPTIEQALYAAKGPVLCTVSVDDPRNENGIWIGSEPILVHSTEYNMKKLIINLILMVRTQTRNFRVLGIKTAEAIKDELNLQELIDRCDYLLGHINSEVAREVIVLYVTALRGIKAGSEPWEILKHLYLIAPKVTSDYPFKYLIRGSTRKSIQGANNAFRDECGKRHLL